MSSSCVRSLRSTPKWLGFLSFYRPRIPGRRRAPCPFSRKAAIGCGNRAPGGSSRCKHGRFSGHGVPCPAAVRKGLARLFGLFAEEEGALDPVHGPEAELRKTLDECIRRLCPGKMRVGFDEDFGEEIVMLERQ